LSASAAGEKHALDHGNELVEDESHGITSRPTHADCWLRHATGGSLYWSITNHNKIKLNLHVMSQKKMRFFGSGRAEANLIGRLGRFILCVVQRERGFS
jgi:hypothetical protein